MDVNLTFEPPGVDISQTPYESQSSAILRRVRELCGWNRPTFPGSQPVSLSATNLKELSRKPYVACEKTDGLRYLLFSASGMVFLIDRKETIRVVEMKLPLADAQQKRDKNDVGVDKSGTNWTTHQSTLLDGELVQDKLCDGTSHVCFLVYDLISLNRNSTVSKFNLLERLKLALLEVIQPRAKYVKENPEAIKIEKQSNNSFFGIYLKDFYEIWDILAIRNASKRLPHLSDGIIFTPVALPYVAGTCRSLLKWKPPELNTVDFAAVLVHGVDAENNTIPIGAKLFIGRRGLRCDSGFWICTSKDHWPMVVDRQRSHHDCDGSIFECAFDAEAEIIVPQFTKDDLSGEVRQWQEEQRSRKKAKSGSSPSTTAESISAVCPYGRVKDSLNYYDFSKAEKIIGGWVVERIRTDKNTPNDERVMHRVKESIDSGIDFVSLFNAALLFQETTAAKKLKPLSSNCQLPEYYETYGSRVAVNIPGEDGHTKFDSDRRKFAYQTALIRDTLAAKKAQQTEHDRFVDELVVPNVHHDEWKPDDPATEFSMQQESGGQEQPITVAVHHSPLMAIIGNAARKSSGRLVRTPMPNLTAAAVVGPVDQVIDQQRQEDVYTVTTVDTTAGGSAFGNGIISVPVTHNMNDQVGGFIGEDDDDEIFNRKISSSSSEEEE